MQLRQYQRDAVDAVFSWFETQAGNPLVVVPTGGGKSVIQSTFLREVFAIDPTARVLCVTHVRELIEQNHRALLRDWPGAPAGIYSAGLRRRDTRSQILFGGVQSIYNRIDEIGGFDLVIVDEAHLIPATGFGRYQQLFAGLRAHNEKLRVIGLTATPYRMDTGRLDRGDDDHQRVFDGVAYECDILQLISDGYLSPLRNIGGVAEIDTSKVHLRGGEYIESELQAAAMVGDLVEQAAEEIVQRAGSRRSWLVFACGIQHAERTAAALRARGVETAVVFGATAAGERDEIVSGFRSGRLKCIVNVGVLTTGFDAPMVDLVVLLRPTKSPGLYVQMVGRGLRIAPGKADCLILDFGGNIAQHGPINQIVLRERRAKKSDDDDVLEEIPELVMTPCMRCRVMLDIAVTVCPNCGLQQPEKKRSPNHETKPEEQLSILSPKQGPIQRWTVRRTDYSEHPGKGGKPSTLRAEYEVSYKKRVSEWVCFNHEVGSFPRKKAERWWSERGGKLPAPESVDLALCRISIGELPEVVEVVVNTTEEFPRVVAAKIDVAEAGWQADAEDAKIPGPTADIPLGDLPF